MKYILLEKNFIMKANRNFNKFNKFKNKNYDKQNIKQPIKIPELYYLSYFLKDSKKDGNKNKIKKSIVLYNSVYYFLYSIRICLLSGYWWH